MQRPSFSARQGGFSVWELVIVVVIIAAAGVVVVPRVQLYQARARQAEAKNNLVVISTLESSFLNAHKAYSADLVELGFKAAANVRYQYKIPSAGETLFTALAQAVSSDVVLPGCGAHDTWTIDQTRHIRAAVDCSSR